jgi:hypothetical protein
MTHANDCWSPPDPDEDELVRAVDASAALRQLLAAASAPPSTAELRGHARAVAEFRATQRSGARTHDCEPAIQSTNGGRFVVASLSRSGRWSARVTVACTALAVLFGDTAATTAVRELPMALRNAVPHVYRHLRRPLPRAKVISALLGPRGAARLNRLAHAHRIAEPTG